MRFGLWTRCNMVTLDSSTRRNSELYVCHLVLYTSTIDRGQCLLVVWSDHARDILNFILHFLPEAVSPSALPTYLPRVPLEVSSAREKRGFTNRKLVVVGHSFGGCAACVLSYHPPEQWSRLTREIA
jgi:hypothetical protein